MVHGEICEESNWWLRRKFWLKFLNIILTQVIISFAKDKGHFFFFFNKQWCFTKRVLFKTTLHGLEVKICWVLAMILLFYYFASFQGKKEGGGVKHFPPFIFGPFGVVCNFPLNFETNQFPLLCGKMSKYPKSVTFSVKSNGIFWRNY